MATRSRPPIPGSKPCCGNLHETFRVSRCVFGYQSCCDFKPTQMPSTSRPYYFVSPCPHPVNVAKCSARSPIHQGRGGPTTLRWLRSAGCYPNKMVRVISYITMGSMQEACRTSIRNSSGNSESMMLTSGPPHGWPPPWLMYRVLPRLAGEARAAVRGVF